MATAMEVAAKGSAVLVRRTIVSFVTGARIAMSSRT